MMREDLNTPEIKAINYETFTPTISATGSVTNGILQENMPTLDGYYGVKRKENATAYLMGQYTPDFYVEYEKECGKNENFKSLRRRLTSFEYDSMLSRAIELSFDGYFQSLDSASKKFTPDF